MGWLVLQPQATHDLAVANQLGCGTTVWNAYPYIMAWWWSHGLPLVVGFPMFAYVQMAQHADYSTPLVNLSTAEHVRRAICDIQSSTTRATA